MKIGYDAKRAFHNATGLGNYSRTLIARQFAQYASDEYWLYNTGTPDKFPDFLAEIKQSKATWHHIQPSFLASLQRTYGFGFRARRAGLDIYHGLSNELPLDWKHGSTKAVVTIHDVIFKRFPEAYKPIDHWIYDYKTRFACVKADLILATSRQTKADLEEWYPESKGKIEVVYQDADEDFSTMPRQHNWPAVLQQKGVEKKPFILCVSKLEQRKNHKNLLPAFKNLLSDVPHDLVLVGSDGDTAHLVQQAQKTMKGRLHSLGKLSKEALIGLYDAADFVVYPSLFEGFGIPLVEAMRRGKAIVSSTSSCFKEVAGEAGIYANPKNFEDISAQLYRMATDANLKAACEEAGKARLPLFDARQLSAKVHGLYESIC